MLNSHIHLDFNKHIDNHSIVPSIGKQNWHKVAKYKNFVLGIHPWQLDSHTKIDLQTLEEQIITLSPIAIGEIGLDFHIKILKDKQIKFFKYQLNLAKKYNLPVIIHSVKSYDKVINILKKYNLKVQIHAFNGSPVQGEKLLKLNCYLSFGLYKKSKKLQEFIKTIPSNKILIETDEKPNKNLIIIAKDIAHLKQIHLSSLIKMCNNNTKSLFGDIF